MIKTSFIIVPSVIGLKEECVFNLYVSILEKNIFSQETATKIISRVQFLNIFFRISIHEKLGVFPNIFLTGYDYLLD